MLVTNTHPRCKQEVFSFLDLPKDIRLEIYDIALGGCTIHFDLPSSGSFRLSVCQHRELDDAVFATSQTVIKATESSGRWRPRHDELCFRVSDTEPPVETISLHLLRLCKQIHREAFLLPFTANTFTFSHPSLLDTFLHDLTTEQAAALRRITLYQPQGKGPFWAAPTGGPMQLLSQSPADRAMTGLREIRVIICISIGVSSRVSPRMPFKEEYFWGTYKLDGRDPQNEMLARMSLQAFRPFPKLKNVEVAIFTELGCYVPQIDFDSWAERIRKMILG